MNELKETYNPIILNNITGGRNNKKLVKYLSKRKGVEFYFQDDYFIIKGINYPVFFAIHKSKLKNFADIIYKADFLCRDEENKKKPMAEFKF